MENRKFDEVRLDAFEAGIELHKIRKLAMVFPGIGYRTDKPLLYYASRLATAHGYALREVHYRGFPDEVNKRDASGRKELVELAMEQTRELWNGVQASAVEEILFISKSIGTAVACAYASEIGRPVRHILFTPLEETAFQGVRDALVFHGTADHYARTEVLRRHCEENRLQPVIFEDANHSLETGDVRRDIVTLSEVMKRVDAFMSTDT
ncbi:MAG: alpha/beta hydrolase [Lachnospiraceae bacterium]|nr:alpha/beta hydrolase [Lachnospiraceae bacterium]